MLVSSRNQTIPNPNTTNLIMSETIWSGWKWFKDDTVTVGCKNRNFCVFTIEIILLLK
jgi:hypothetical protein